MQHLVEKVLTRPIGSYRISAGITSHITGMQRDAHGEIVVFHRLNDEPRTRKAKLRQDGRGEHFFTCCGDKLYISDYTPINPANIKIYRCH